MSLYDETRLAIVKHLAESIGASVAVTSDLGRGARFSITLPKGATMHPES